MTRVFIVEDEAIIAMELADRLRELGYEVCGRAARGEQALERIPSSAPDVVLMDVNLGRGMNGLAVAEKLRPSCDAAVVFLTAYSGGELEGAREDAAYLVKPFQPQALRSAIESALARTRGAPARST